MFERAAISQGEESHVKKRKVAKATGAASKQRRQNEKRSSAPKRVVSDGMLITKPGVSAFKQPRDPQLQNSHTPDALQLNLGDPRVMNDRVPVVAPFTSMDIISARPSSNMTLQNMAMYSSPSQQDTHNSTESFKTNPLNTTPNTIDDFITRSKAHHADDRLMVRPRRAVDVSQNMCLGTIIEEVDSTNYLDSGISSTILQQNSTVQSIKSTAGRGRDENTSNDFDPYEEGLSDRDLLQWMDHGITPALKNKPTCTANECDAEDVEFDEGWGALEDEDFCILDQTEASMVPATILNQASSSFQKVQVTPIAVSSTGAETENGQTPDLKPILRRPFPDLARDRSPIIGLSSTLSLRTCFRVGEALNAGSQAVREHQSVIIELYARVQWSFREPRSVRQHFIFMDLFHDRPPYLSGIYEHWKGVELHERDSGRFLERSHRPLVCRCVGKLNREGTSWKLAILNVWEATLDDVEHAAEIIQS